MKQTEVTQAEWSSVGFANPSTVLDSGAGDCDASDCPVGNVTWFDALEYANKAGAAAGLPRCYELSDCVGTPGAGASAQPLLALARRCPTAEGSDFRRKPSGSTPPGPGREHQFPMETSRNSAI